MTVLRRPSYCHCLGNHYYLERDSSFDIDVSSRFAIDVVSVGREEVDVFFISDIVDAAEQLEAYLSELEDLCVERQI